MHNEVYVRQNELYPWVRKRNGIKFYAGELFYLNLSSTCLCPFLARKNARITQNSFYLFTLPSYDAAINSQGQKITKIF